MEFPDDGDRYETRTEAEAKWRAAARNRLMLAIAGFMPTLGLLINELLEAC